jgi:CHAD domain-containing protein
MANTKRKKAQKKSGSSSVVWHRRKEGTNRGVDGELSGIWGTTIKLARQEIDHFLSLVPKILRDDDPLAVHKMRVTSRRVEQFLILLYAKPIPQHIRRFRRNVKRCRRLLGELRNCDVLSSVAEAELSQNLNPHKEAWEAVNKYLQVRRERKAPAILRQIGRIKLVAAYVRLKRDMEAGGSCFEMVSETEIAELGNSWENQLVHRRVTLSLENRWRGFEGAIESARREPGEEELVHGIRIATKRLRYLGEVMVSLNFPGSPEIVEWLRTVQRTIGEWHDLEVLEHIIIRMLAHEEIQHDPSGLAEKLEKLILKNRKIKQTSEAAFSRMTLNSGEYRAAQKWVYGLVPGDTAED